MRTLKADLERELAENGPDLPVYWGNRNWKPFLTDTLQQMADDGVTHALALFTTAYSSYSSCRQFRENIAEAQAQVGPNAPQVDKIRAFYNYPDFIEANVKQLNAALDQIPAERRADVQIAFTAHSIPLAMAENSRYVSQLEEACRLIAESAHHPNWRLVYQSRSGPPHQPWLEPDICDYMTDLHDDGVNDLIIAPIGFLSDHMEVVYDLDTEARQLADELGMTMIRAGTIESDPMFIKMIRQLIIERMSEAPVRRYLGNYGPSHDVCPANCCLSGRPQMAGKRPMERQS
jgi:ferrochelatase